MTLTRIIETGSYTGNGATQSITIGWQPAFIVIAKAVSTGATGNRSLSFKFASQGGATFTANSNTAEELSGVTISSTGFDLGSDVRVNDSGDTYYYMAIRAGPWIDTGSYTGNGSSQTVTLGRQPCMVMAAGGTTTYATTIKNDQEATGFSEANGSSNFVTTGWTISSTGFTVSDATFNNENATTYHYVAFYAQVGATQHWDCGSWTGDASSPQTVTLGRQPMIVLAFGVTGSADSWNFKTDGMPGDDTAMISNNYSWDTANRVTLISTGFTVGSDINASGDAYRYIAGYA